MHAVTREWIAKAEGDWATAQREVRARRQPNYDAACFHAQQCAEKYLKARLQEAGIAFPRTHNLLFLLALVAPLEPTWDSLRTHLQTLTGLAIEVRYPGVMATRADAREAVAACRTVRSMARDGFGLT